MRLETVGHEGGECFIRQGGTVVLHHPADIGEEDKHILRRQIGEPNHRAGHIDESVAGKGVLGQSRL